MKTPYRIVYKVISGDPGLYYSLCTSSEYRLIYGLNEWTTPNIGKIFAFSTLKAAKKFAGDAFPIFIALAFYVKPLKKGARFFADVENFWLHKSKKISTDLTPPGTVGCEKLMLLEKLTPKLN